MENHAGHRDLRHTSVTGSFWKDFSQGYIMNRFAFFVFVFLAVMNYDAVTIHVCFFV